MSVARVQARGQVTVPQNIREACGIEAGSDLLFVQTSAHTFECRVLPARRSLTEVVDQYTVDGVAPDLAPIREEVADEMAREYMQSCLPHDAETGSPA